jgi:iron complex outermembrane recepter protein
MDNVFFEWVPVANFYRLPATANLLYNYQNPIYFDGGTREQLSTNGFQQYWQYGTSAQTWGISPQLDWVLGPLQVTYLSSFREQHEHYIYGAPLTPTYAMPNIYVSSDETNSQELRFATTGAGPLQAQFGLYYFREALYDNWSVYDFPQVLHFGYLAVGSDPLDSRRQPTASCRPFASRWACASRTMKRITSASRYGTCSPFPIPPPTR